MITYFVSYSHAGGFGTCQLTLRHPIRDSRDIDAVRQAIQRDNGLAGIVVINWRRFED